MIHTEHSVPAIPSCIPRKVVSIASVKKEAKRAIEINPLNRPNGVAMYKRLGRMPTPEELALATKKYWGVGGVRLTVGFLDNASQELRNRILSHMNAWNKTANIEFIETQNAQDADVRINRERINDPQWGGYWSYLGTDITLYQGPNGQNMNLEAFTMATSDSEFYRVVRHEAGHALGFPHEHMRAELVAKIDRAKAVDFYKTLAGWTPQDVDQQVLTPLNPTNIEGTSIPDVDSIMTYHIPGIITNDGRPIPGGDDISPIDYDFAGLIYPK